MSPSGEIPALARMLKISSGRAQESKSPPPANNRRHPMKDVRCVPAVPVASAAVKPGSSTSRHIHHKKCDARTQGFMQINIRSAGARKPSCQLAIAERAAQGHSRHHQPNHQQPKWRATDFAIAAGVKNIPAAITSPATTAVAEASPSRRSSSAPAGFSATVAIEICRTASLQ